MRAIPGEACWATPPPYQYGMHTASAILLLLKIKNTTSLYVREEKRVYAF